MNQPTSTMKVTKTKARRPMSFLGDLWEGAMKAEFKGLSDLDRFEFADVVPDIVNVVSARWGFA